MFKVKLDLKSLSPAQLVAKAKQLITALTANPQFPTLHPTLAQLTSATEALDLAIAQTQQTRQTLATQISIRYDKEAELASLLRQLAAYIESVSGEDESKILSAGMSLRSQASASVEVIAPSGLKATPGDHEGEVDLSWDKVKHAKSYVIERSADPPSSSSWMHQSIAAKTSTTVGGLVSGTRYWFRVASVTSNGQSGWSDPSPRIAS